jgi:hypothetical protein
VDGREDDILWKELRMLAVDMRKYMGTVETVRLGQTT